MGGDSDPLPSSSTTLVADDPNASVPTTIEEANPVPIEEANPVPIEEANPSPTNPAATEEANPVPGGSVSEPSATPVAAVPAQGEDLECSPVEAMRAKAQVISSKLEELRTGWCDFLFSNLIQNPIL